MGENKDSPGGDIFGFGEEMATARPCPYRGDGDQENELQRAFQNSVMDRTYTLKSGQSKTEEQKMFVLEGSAQLFQDVSWFVLATRDQFVSRFMHCELAIVDDIAVHLPVVLANFVSTSKNPVCKYMKEWRGELGALKMDEILIFLDTFKQLPIKWNSSSLSLRFLDSRRPAPAPPADVPAESQFRKIIPRKRKHGHESPDEVKMAAPDEVKLHVARLCPKIKLLKRSMQQIITRRDFAAALLKRTDAVPNEDPVDREEWMTALNISAAAAAPKEMIRNSKNEKPTE
jgi:hypothetical protein